MYSGWKCVKVLVCVCGLGVVHTPVQFMCCMLPPFPRALVFSPHGCHCLSNNSIIRWLNETPTSRINTRCTQDIATIDGTLPWMFIALVETTTNLLSNLGGIIFFSPIFIVPGLSIGIIGMSIGHIYLKAQLSLKQEMRWVWIHSFLKLSWFKRKYKLVILKILVIVSVDSSMVLSRLSSWSLKKKLTILLSCQWRLTT